MVESKDTVRVGVVGAGAMGTAHIETLARWVPGAQVAAVFDADLDRAREVAGRVGADVAPSGEDLIAADAVDAVLVAAPDPLHEELALACLAAGKPTLCEKPSEIRPVDVLHREEKLVAHLFKRIHLNDVRMIEAHRELRLIDEHR